MRSALRRSAAVLAILSIAGLTDAAPATAQKLPWSDANPLERLFGKPAPRKTTARRHQSKRSAPKASATGAVPVPNQRPATPANVAVPAAAAATAAAIIATEADAKAPGADAADTKPPAEVVAEQPAAAEATPPVPRAEDVPKPEASPAPPVEAKAPQAPAEPATPVEPEVKSEQKPAIDSDAGVAEVAGAVATTPIDPAVTAAKPVDEIPVPDQRPAAPGEKKPAVEAEPKKTASPTPPDEKAAEEDAAPNSTEKLKARTTAVSPAAAVLAAAAVEDAEACEAELKTRGVEFTVEDSISEGECGVLRPVAITRLSSGITVSPKTQMLCRTALALDDWMTKGVVPAAKADLPDRKLTEFRHASTYVCRPRASEKGISEHARGSAIDIASFVFDKGEEIGVAAKPAGSPEAKFQDSIRAAACGPFKTVLGPGTDSDHDTHFHLDIAARNNGATYCK